MSVKNLIYYKKEIDKLLDNKTIIRENEVVPKYNNDDYPYKFYPDWDSGIFSNGVKIWAVTLCINIRYAPQFYRYGANKVERIIKTYQDEIKGLIENYNVPLFFDKGPNRFGSYFYNRNIISNADSIYAVFITPEKYNIQRAFSIALEINTFHYWFQKILRQKGLPTFNIGIGIGAGQDVYCKFVGFDCHEGEAWLGKGAIDAINLANYGNDGSGTRTIVVNRNFFYNLADADKKLFFRTSDYTKADLYHCDCYYIEKIKWIDEEGLY